MYLIYSMVKKIETILVPLDGSKNSVRGLDTAIYFARRCQAIILCLYVIPVYPENFSDSVNPFRMFFLKDSETILGKAKTKAAKKGVLLKTKLTYGNPSAEIIDLAKKRKVDLIVIGSRGRTGLKEIFLGSVANAVVHKSRVPVLVVK